MLASWYLAFAVYLGALVWLATFRFHEPHSYKRVRCYFVLITECSSTTDITPSASLFLTLTFSAFVRVYLDLYLYNDYRCHFCLARTTATCNSSIPTYQNYKCYYR